MYSSAGVVVVVLAILAVTNGSDKYPEKEGSQNIAQGARKMVLNKPADVHLYHESIKTDGSVMSVQSQDICFPHKKRKQAKFTITAFNVNGVEKGGLAWVKKDGGGVGKHKVCFHVKGPRGHGYHFDIDVYGTYK